jgi:hypothetical protein
MPSSLDWNPGERQPRAILPESCDEHWREFPCILAVVCLLFSAMCTSCGVVGSDPPPPATVAITPNSAQPYTGGDVQFQAIVQNSSSSAVTWQVNQIPGGNTLFGTINSTGNYSAPSQVPNTPTVTVSAVLKDNPSASGSALVTIQALSGIQGLSLSPVLASVTSTQSLQLRVVTPGVTASDVNWAVDGIANGNAAVGTISPSGNFGVYSPPVTPGPHLVTATLIANPGAVGSATVEVTDFTGALTWRNDTSRSGANSEELALAPLTVNSSTFGRLFHCPIDGYAYAQPLYVPNLKIPGSGPHNVIFVATENDSVFAFDADTSPCVQLWQTHDSIIPPGSQPIQTPDLVITTASITPLVGITGTPVIDLAASALYVVAATETIPSAEAQQPIYSHRLYALDLATGQPKMQAAGVEIGTPAGQTSIFFPSLENQRPALLLDDGTVYIAFGSYGTPGDSLGWIFRYDSSTLLPTGFFEVSPNTFGGGIWQSGGGPSADSNHDVFVVTGDGAFNANRGLQSYSDSFLRLGTEAGLTVADYFTPCDQSLLESEGFDVGAGSPVLLPESSSQPHLLIGGSKGGSLYVVNRDAMGGFCPNSSTSAQTVKVPGLNAMILSTPLFWNNSVYVAPGNGNLMAFPMSTEGILAASPSASQSPEMLGPQGATPVISANGTSDAILWLIDTSGAQALPYSPAILRAYDPNNLSNEIYNSTVAASSRDQAGPAVKFTVPTVANGKVYVGTQTELDVYGFLQ